MNCDSSRKPSNIQYLLKKFDVNMYFLKAIYNYLSLFRHCEILKWENKEELIADGKLNFKKGTRQVNIEAFNIQLSIQGSMIIINIVIITTMNYANAIAETPEVETNFIGNMPQMFLYSFYHGIIDHDIFGLLTYCNL